MTEQLHDQRYPLHWPEGRPRTNSRSASAFKRDRSFAEARDLLLHELHLLGAKRVILSSNVALRNDGLPRSGQAQPSDPGVAVYFELALRGMTKPHTMSCDRWRHVEDNAYALAKHVEALRGQQRWGVATVEQAFAGFAQLPAKRIGRWAGWRDCFRTGGSYGNMTKTQTLDWVEREYREHLKAFRATHPAGDHPDEAELNALRDEARKECSL